MESWAKPAELVEGTAAQPWSTQLQLTSLILLR
jgi:hypothetical protein